MDESVITIIPESEQKINYKTYVNFMTKLGRSVAKREDIHAKKCYRNKIMGKCVSYPASICAALILFSGIAQFSRHSSKPECSPDLWLQIFSTVLGLITLLLVGTRDFFMFEKKEVKHDKAAKDLEAFFATIDAFRSLNKDSTGDRLYLINGFAKQYHEISKTLPIIGDVNDKLEFSYVEKSSSENSEAESEEQKPTRHRSIERNIAVLTSTNLTDTKSKKNSLSYNLGRLEDV